MFENIYYHEYEDDVYGTEIIETTIYLDSGRIEIHWDCGLCIHTPYYVDRYPENHFIFEDFGMYFDTLNQRFNNY